MKLRGLATVLTTLAIISTASLASTASANALPDHRAVSEKQDDQRPPLPAETRVSIPLDHPIALREAVQIAAKMTEPVVAFRFENPHLSGEYSPASGRAVDDYLTEFERSYATQPQITELIVVRTRDPTPIGAYADYNDLLDDCDRNSMTIGIRYPQLLLQHSAGAELLISIEAPAGTMPFSVVAGVVQATSDDFCRTPLGSLYSLTDCMGIYPGSWPLPDVEQARRTLNEDRSWIAPVVCWVSTKKGEIPPVRTPCPGNHLGLAGWGANWAGELGVGTIDVAESLPVQVPGGALAGTSFSILGSNNAGYTNCAIRTNQPYCWGNGGYGNLGNGTNWDSVTPVPVDMSGALAGLKVTQIETSFSGTCVIASGQPFCWGAWWHVGGGAHVNVPFPIDTTGVLSGKTVTDIAVYDAGACVIADWAPFCWGGGNSGELGNGTTVNFEPYPVAVDTTGALAGKLVTDITAGFNTICAIADYRAYCWGNNYGGQIGNGSTVSSNVPVAVGGPLSSLDVTALGGGHFPCAVAAGAAYCWGRGSYGTLGTGETYTVTGAGSRETLPTPVDASGVLAGKTVTHIGTADFHGCVLADGAPYCWGTNWDSALSDSIPDGATAWSPVAIATTGTPLENEVSIGLTIGGGSTIVAFAD